MARIDLPTVACIMQHRVHADLMWLGNYLWCLHWF